jgi:hypothetical protein
MASNSASRGSFERFGLFHGFGKDRRTTAHKCVVRFRQTLPRPGDEFRDEEAERLRQANDGFIAEQIEQERSHGVLIVWAAKIEENDCHAP